MIYYKTKEEIQKIRESADILSRAHGLIASMVKPGIPTKELDAKAEEFILDHGGRPSFKGFNGFEYALCISVNENVVHGFPSDYVLKDGDIISVDCGVFYNGFHSDCAYTYPVGTVNADTLKLLRVTKESLYLGIEKAVAGNRIGDIGYAIQHFVEAEGPRFERPLRDEWEIKNLDAPDPAEHLGYVLEAVSQVRKALAGDLSMLKELRDRQELEVDLAARASRRGVDARDDPGARHVQVLPELPEPRPQGPGGLVKHGERRRSPPGCSSPSRSRSPRRRR